MITGDRQDNSQEQRRRSQELGKRWADAYDCWVDPPGADEPIYLCPQDSDVTLGELCEGDGDQRPVDVEKNQSLPREIFNLKHPIYGITASNPMGNDQSDDLNEKLNRLLQDDFVRYRNASTQSSSGIDTDNDDKNNCCGGKRQPATIKTTETREIVWWHSFGFGASFHEKGFAVSAERSLVDDLARKYQQGAIYEFRVTRTNGITAGGKNRKTQAGEHLPDAMTTMVTNVSIVRKTIPILVPDVEADIRMTRCHRPPLATSDPNYCKSSEY